MEVKRIIDDVSEEIGKVRSKDIAFIDHLSNILNLYKNKIYSVNNIHFNKYHIDKDDLIKHIEKSKSIMKDAFNKYSSAKIVDCVNIISSYINDLKSYILLEIDNESVENNKWFRMRLQEKNKRIFPASEMFHIPFELRGKVNTQRYSLPGYPCLYISKTVWATWEELHEPQLSQFCVSMLKPQFKFKVLDLRLRDFDKIEDRDIKKLAYSLPLIVACSIKVLCPDDNYKPEYIIPQMVMLSIVNDKECIGCIYTSCMNNKYFEWKCWEKLENIALPVEDASYSSGLCPRLRSLFKITDSTNYDYEMLSKPFETTFSTYRDCTLEIHTAFSYEDSIFGQLEKRLEKRDLKDL